MYESEIIRNQLIGYLMLHIRYWKFGNSQSINQLFSESVLATLCRIITCIGTGAEWSSSGNGSSLLFDDGRFDASLLLLPDVVNLAAPSSLVEWLLFLDTLTATGPAPSSTKTDKRYTTA